MITAPNSFELQIKSALQCAQQKAHQEGFPCDGRWTHIIKKELADLGEQQGYKICTSGFDDFYNDEWLYDMVWYKEDAVGKLITVPLTVESEWGKKIDQIKFDFEKLLLANSQYRLMICQSYPSNIESLQDYLQQAIQDYQLNHTGDRYLVAILNIHEGEFEFVVFTK